MSLVSMVSSQYILFSSRYALPYSTLSPPSLNTSLFSLCLTKHFPSLSVLLYLAPFPLCLARPFPYYLCLDRLTYPSPSLYALPSPTLTLCALSYPAPFPLYGHTQTPPLYALPYPAYFPLCCSMAGQRKCHIRVALVFVSLIGVTLGGGKERRGGTGGRGGRRWRI